MQALELINTKLTALRPSDTVAVALSWMDEWRVGQLPVVDNRKLLGIVKDTHLLAVEDEQTAIQDLPLEKEDLFVHQDQSLFEFIHFFTAYEVEVVPVVDSDKNFQGIVGQTDVFSFFAQSFSVESGGVIVLAMDYRDYSLSEISRLVESNNARIMGSVVEVSKESSSKIFLTLKLNVADLQFVMATLTRFGYKIVAEFQWQENAVSIESERLNSLMRYLEI